MNATVLHIDQRERPRVSQIASLSDFTCMPGEAFDAQQIIDNANISIYCLDHAARQAIFTELPPGIDLAQASFYYQAQFDQAQRLIAIPYDVLYKLTDRISLDTSRLILIHNIGRCGSTLLSTALNEVDSVVSLSEPDTFSNFVALRYEDRDEVIRLLQCCARMLFRPAVAGQFSRYSIKLRNQCVDIMDLYAAAFPEAKHLFLYRDALGWVASIYRLMSRHDPPPPISRAEAVKWQAAYYNRSIESVDSFFDPTVDTYSRGMLLGGGWLTMMARYLELYAEGFRPLALRYEDLNAQPERILNAVFDFCGLPSSRIAQALTAFERDSQENTKLARDNAQTGNTIRLPDDLAAWIRANLSRHPVINTSDFVLPGTLD